MGKIKLAQPVRLVVGFIFRQEAVFSGAKKALEKKFGLIDFESQAIPFTRTRYYEEEFGTNLIRRFVSFKGLILPQDLPDVKGITNKIEERFSRNGRRSINIDPGYVDMAKLVLASTKDYRQRIYLDKGIYAEITLFYADKSFRAWEWTYPDYASQEYISIFNSLRERYVRQVRGNK